MCYTVLYSPDRGRSWNFAADGSTARLGHRPPAHLWLEEEEFAHARLVGRLLKAALLFVVGALALWQLNFARNIVLSAFLIAFGAIGITFTLAVGLGSIKAIQKGWETLFEKRKKD